MVEPARLGNAELLALHGDGLGSVRLVTDAAQAIVERSDYSSFGEDSPTNNLDPSGQIVSAVICPNKRPWDTDCFVWHYVHGFGRTVDLVEVGLLPALRAAKDTKAALQTTRGLIEAEAARHAKKLCNDCDKGTRSFTFGTDRRQSTGTLPRSLACSSTERALYSRVARSSPSLCGLLKGICLTLLLTACIQGDFGISLPGGWELSRWSSGEYVVFKTEPNSTAVKIRIGPTVERYQVVGHVITGHVAASDFPVPERPVLGYFVVDTATDRVWQGLDDATWRQRLRDLGVREEPRLQRPTRHDRQYGPMPAAS